MIFEDRFDTVDHSWIETTHSTDANRAGRKIATANENSAYKVAHAEEGQNDE